MVKSFSILYFNKKSVLKTVEIVLEIIASSLRITNVDNFNIGFIFVCSLSSNFSECNGLSIISKLEYQQLLLNLSIAHSRKSTKVK